ncbi:MAG: hypothetical protein HYX24_01535 [Candidatus Aenigmarchaeota archaeon]|nr:hypothetical protein [Candidatus Aenigmarchaeota archaeon]
MVNLKAAWNSTKTFGQKYKTGIIAATAITAIGLAGIFGSFGSRPRAPLIPYNTPITITRLDPREVYDTNTGRPIGKTALYWEGFENTIEPDRCKKDRGEREYRGTIYIGEDDFVLEKLNSMENGLKQMRHIQIDNQLGVKDGRYGVGVTKVDGKYGITSYFEDTHAARRPKSNCPPLP